MRKRLDAHLKDMSLYTKDGLSWMVLDESRLIYIKSLGTFEIAYKEKKSRAFFWNHDQAAAHPKTWRRFFFSFRSVYRRYRRQADL